MSDVWYFADEGTPRGPMSLSDLVRVLSVVHNPGDALIWRAGFHGWTKASDVSEVVLRPPPLPPPPVPPRHIAEPVTIEQGIKLKMKPLPIGGWLVLMAIGQIVAPFRVLYSIGEYYTTLDWSIARTFPAAFIGEALLNAAIISVVIATSVLFWRKSRNFPRFFVYETMAVIAALPLNALWVAATISASSGQPFVDLFNSSFDPKETGRTIAAGISGCLWSWYLYKSKRVAQTFIL